MRKAIYIFICLILTLTLSATVYGTEQTTEEATADLHTEDTLPQTEPLPTEVTTSAPETPQESDFLISGSTLISYTGSAEEVTVPEGITLITSGAFVNAPSLRAVRVTVDCYVEPGAFPRGITVYGYASSAAHRVAAFCDCSFVDITPPYVTIIVKYVYQHGAPAALKFQSHIKPGADYSVKSPEINGFRPDIPVAEGTAGPFDINITVTYSQNNDDGWHITGNTVKYYENGKSVKNTERTVDGVVYSFDSNGNVMLDGAFLNVNGNTYYLVNQAIVTGYRVIGQAIYCFGSDGVMKKSTVFDGIEFDINGTVMGIDGTVNIEGDTYYLINNLLYSGYKVMGENVCYFGADYKMVKGVTLNSYVFDENGYVSSGIDASELDVKVKSVTYTGSAAVPEYTVYFKDQLLKEGVHYTVKLSDNVKPGKATLTLTGVGAFKGTKNEKFDIVGKEAHTLTIKYLNVTGGSIASEYVTKLENGSEYSIKSPVIPDHTPDKEIVKGKMGDKDITVTVTYKKTVVESDTTDTGSNGDWWGGNATHRPMIPDEPETTVATTKEPSTEPEETVKTIYHEVVESEVIYNFELLGKVVVIATVICGCLIFCIVKWDLIRSPFVKHKAGRR